VTFGASGISSVIALANPHAFIFPCRKDQEGVIVFHPDQSSPVYGQPVTLKTTATFGAPGTYVLRAIVSDEELETTRDVTVDVRELARVEK
jgi:hypothetical protein